MTSQAKTSGHSYGAYAWIIVALLFPVALLIAYPVLRHRARRLLEHP